MLGNDGEAQDALLDADEGEEEERPSLGKNVRLHCY